MIVSSCCLSRGCKGARRLQHLSTHSPIKTPGTEPGACSGVDNSFRRLGRRRAPLAHRPLGALPVSALSQLQPSLP